MGEVIERVNLQAHDMIQKDQIAGKTGSYIIINIERTEQFFMLPKIYERLEKQPGRPIVSGSRGLTEK